MFAPNWKYTIPISKFVIVCTLSILYSVLIIYQFHKFDLRSFSTLENVKLLFQQDDGLLAGWIHYLSFDLFIGIYILKRTQELKIPHSLNFIILPITFLFGPLGYLLFVIINLTKSKYDTHKRTL